MNSKILQVSLIFCITISLLVQRLEAQDTPDPVCTSTGHRCITPDQCSSLSLPNGVYQWCGGCGYHVRCLGGVGELFEPFSPVYTQWDDNKKNFELTSTTCVECYYPCPPGPSAPTNPSGLLNLETISIWMNEDPLCNKTGLGCLNATCPGGANGNFQYCGDCSNYVICSLQTGYSRVACPTGTKYDDFFRTCLTTSTTCRECYATCSAITTPPTTPEPPSPPASVATTGSLGDTTANVVTPIDASVSITINFVYPFKLFIKALNAIVGG